MIKPLSEGEILVKVEAALTCGTDVKTFRRGHPVLIKEIPSGFGHEFAGVVEKIAEGAFDYKNAALATLAQKQFEEYENYRMFK